MYDPAKDVVIIGIDTPADPTHFGYDAESNQTPLLEASVLFTVTHGIIQPLLGRRDGEKVVIVAGRGRTRLLREANARRVADGLVPWLLPVRIVRGDEKQMRILKHGENSHRREQNPMARARHAYELSQLMPEAEAASTMGLGLPQFKAVMKFLDLAPEVQKGVQKGDLKPTAALELAALSEADQTAKLAEIMASSNGKRVTQREVKAKLHAANGQEPAKTPSTRIKKVVSILDKLDDGATKDDLWETIKKIRNTLKG
jgi:ParB-like chromosome segregation protein Spo0J